MVPTMQKGKVVSGSPTVIVGGKAIATTDSPGVHVRLGAGTAGLDRHRRDGRLGGVDVSDEFIGRGWAFPLRTDATGGIAPGRAASSEIEESIRLILGTAPGERPDAARVRLPRSTTTCSPPADGETANAIAVEVRSALRRWEPRIDVEDVVVTFDARDADDLLYIDIRYAIRRTNDRRNLVFPFYVIPARSPTTSRSATWPCPSPTSTTAGSRTSSTTRSASSQQRCPEWTDHNVSDPGVTLIELFAWMTDQLVYRLNRVPDRHYVKFLELHRRVAVPADRGADRASRSGSPPRSRTS